MLNCHVLFLNALLYNLYTLQNENPDIREQVPELIRNEKTSTGTQTVKIKTKETGKMDKISLIKYYASPSTL